MSRYLWITPMQEPFHIGTDDNQRPIFSCNYEGRADRRPSQLEEEIYRWLYDGGLVTGLNVDTFIGPIKPIIGTHAFVNLMNTGGTRANETHNNDVYGNFSFQVLVRHQNYVTARTKAQAICARLTGVRNQTITVA